MKLSIPCNWDFKLIDDTKKDAVDEFYGKLSKDVIGGGRMAFTLPSISKQYVANYVKKIHQHNLKFNYLLNSTCLGNIEWSRAGQREICRFLDWLLSINVDSITVSMPYLLQLIKERYPRFKVYISNQVGISSLMEAKYWQDLGADRLTLSVHKVNRDFKLLVAMKRSLKCQIQLIVNLHCLKDCPFWLYHGTSSSHSSQLGRGSNRLVIDYSFIMCSLMRLKDPVEFLRSGWIRPEDIRYYEEIGIDRFKLVNRTMPTDDIVSIIKAYTNRRHEGNLLDLFSDPTRTLILQKQNLLHKIKYFFHPLSINMSRLMEAKKLIGQTGIYIDNRSLDEFIKYFLEEGQNCNFDSCFNCNYCNEAAKKAVRITDRNALIDLIDKYENFLAGLISGRIFRYL